MFDRASMTPIERRASRRRPVAASALAPDGTLVVVEQGTVARFHDLDDRARRVAHRPRAAGSSELDRFVVTQGAGNLLIGVGSERAVRRWDLDHGPAAGDPGLAPFGARAAGDQPGAAVAARRRLDAAAASRCTTWSRTGRSPSRCPGTARGRVTSRSVPTGGTSSRSPTTGWSASGATTSEAGPISTLIDGRVSDPAYSADGRRVAVRVADGAEVRDAARPASPA